MNAGRGQSFRPKLSSCQPKRQMRAMTLHRIDFPTRADSDARGDYVLTAVLSSSCSGKRSETRVSTGICFIVDNGYSWGQWG